MFWPITVFAICSLALLRRLPANAIVRRMGMRSHYAFLLSKTFVIDVGRALRAGPLVLMWWEFESTDEGNSLWLLVVGCVGACILCTAVWCSEWSAWMFRKL